MTTPSIPDEHESVLIRVEPTDASGRLINERAGLAETIDSRIEDIERGIRAGVAAIEKSLPTLSSPAGWGFQSVELKFGVSLGVEGSVFIAKATSQAAFEVTVAFAPKP